MLVIFGIPSRTKERLWAMFFETEKWVTSSDLSTPRRKEVFLRWSLSCERLGFRSGGVYFVLPFPTTPEKQFGNIGVRYVPTFSSSPLLIVCDVLCRKLSDAQLSAVIQHECGHLYYVPYWSKVLMDIVSLPSLLFFLLLCALRDQCEAKGKVPHMLYAIERLVFSVTVLAALHAEEYAADAHAVSEQGTTKHMIEVLLWMYREEFSSDEIASQSIMEALTRAQKKESHRSTHPHPHDRMLRLEMLRRNP
jgi:Zn-dependent protease with chaperone function